MTADYPVATPLLTNLLARKLMAEHRETPELEHAVEGTLFRHSDAGKCARLIGLKAAGYPESNPPDAASVWSFWLGHTIHEALQEVLAEQFPGAVIEACVTWDDFSASGHLDARVDIPNDSDKGFWRITYELKTKGQYPFDKAIGVQRQGYKLKAPEGPDAGAKLQGALNAVADDADELRIGYIGYSSLSIGLANKLSQEDPRFGDDESRFLAEWSYTPDQFRPWAQQEKSRVLNILRVVEEDTLPDRWVVDDDMSQKFLNPDTLKEGIPTAFNCQYCSHCKLCRYIGPGEVPLPIEGIPWPGEEEYRAAKA